MALGVTRSCIPFVDRNENLLAKESWRLTSSETNTGEETGYRCCKDRLLGERSRIGGGEGCTVDMANISRRIRKKFQYMS